MPLRQIFIFEIISNGAKPAPIHSIQGEMILIPDQISARERRARDVALFRYSLIRDAADPKWSSRQRGLLIRIVASEVHKGPDGRPVRVSRATLDRWVRAYRANGFDGLVPAPRQVGPRTPEQLLTMAVALKKENLSRTAAQVHRIMAEASPEVPVPSERTLQRHFADLGLRAAAQPPAAFGRFEAEGPNDLWTGDAMHGPRVAGGKAILFAFIDDHSRYLVGYRWVRVEDTIRAQRVIRDAIQARGVPAGVFLDNGAPFVAATLNRALACLGIRLVHSRPGKPQGRGKIERFFRTVRAQFLVEYQNRPPVAMDELNEAFAAWVETVYHQQTHSETGQAPAERWEAPWASRAAAGHAGPAYPTAASLHEAFLWTARRRVKKTATVSMEGNEYEVDASLVGQEVELLFDPFNLADIEVRHRGRPVGRAIPQVISANVHRKARPDETTNADDGGASAGIDYLGLLKQRAADHIPAIDFTRIASTPTASTPTASRPAASAIMAAGEAGGGSLAPGAGIDLLGNVFTLDELEAA